MAPITTIKHYFTTNKAKQGYILFQGVTLQLYMQVFEYEITTCTYCRGKISVCFGLWLVASNYAYFTVISIVTTYGV